jgi:recombination protein RecR
MIKYPKPIDDAINAFSQLPGIGRKTAERFVFYLLKQPKGDLEHFAEDIKKLQENHFFCPQCFNFSIGDGLCEICRTPNRDATKVCVVEEAHDLIVIENTNEFNGLYHVLGGKIDPIEGVTAETLRINQLKTRVQEHGVQELILALNPDIQGEATVLYLKNIFKPLGIKLTLLARGLPMGSDIEYADEITLANALKGRQELS